MLTSAGSATGSLFSGICGADAFFADTFFAASFVPDFLAISFDTITLLLMESLGFPPHRAAGNRCNG